MDAFYAFLFSQVASTEVFIALVILVAGVLIYKKKVREGIVFALGAAGLGLSVWLLKITFQVPRLPNPEIEASGYAFPSGHAASAVFLATVALMYISRIKNPFQRYGLSAVVLGLALSIGASRVAYNVHTPIQVLAGFALGIIWGLGTYWFLSRKAKEE